MTVGILHTRAHGPAAGGAGTWQQLKLGAGGFVTGIQFANDGTRVIRTDTSGAYVWTPGATKWAQLNVKGRMPIGEVISGLTQGSYCIGICKGNSNHIYMYNGNPSNTGYLYHSADQGLTFTRTAKPNLVIDPNNQDAPSTRLMSPYMSVEPTDPLRVYCSSPVGGLFKSTDGNNFSTTGMSGVGTGDVISSQGGGHLVLLDPSSSVVGNVTQTQWCSTYGHGLYKSTDGGANWTLQNSAGMPTKHLSLAISPSGTIWYIDAAVGGGGAGSLYRYKSGVWTTQIPWDVTGGTYKQFSAVAVNPLDSNKVYACDYHGYIWYTLNGDGASPTWVGPLSFTYSSPDIPWHAWANDPSLGIAQLAFDPLQSGVMYAATGIGVFKCTAPTTNAPFVWTSESQGIENLVVSAMVSVPGGPLLMSSWDRPIWVVNDPTVYQSRYFPGNAREIDPSRWAEYCASSPNIFSAIPQIQGMFKSTDSGLNWTATGLPSAVPNNGHSGNVAMGSASVWVWVISNVQPSTVAVWNTQNGGTSWSACTITGGDNQDSWFHQAAYLNRCSLVCDRVASNIFYLYNSGINTNPAGLYRSTDGITFTRVFSGVISGSGVSPSSTSWQMTAVPGKQGHLFFATMQDPHGTIPNGFGLWRTSNADSGNPPTITQVANVQGIASFGFGKAKPSGGGYPVMYLIGWASTDGGATYNYGAWKSEDLDQGIPTFINIGDGYPTGVFDYIYKVEGDMNTYNRCYVAFLGSGAAMYY